MPLYSRLRPTFYSCLRMSTLGDRLRAAEELAKQHVEMVYAIFTFY
jgi:hypothetical protein